MSASVTNGSSPPDGATDPSSALTPLDRSAAEFMAAITAATKLIPRFQPAHPEIARFVRRYRGFKREAIPAAIAAVQQTPQLEGADSFDIEHARFTVQYSISYRPATVMVATLLRNMVFSDDYNNALALKDALQIYAIANAFGRDPSSAGAAAHASNIKSVLRRPRAPKKTDKSTPSEPAPSPATNAQGSNVK